MPPSPRHALEQRAMERCQASVSCGAAGVACRKNGQMASLRREVTPPGDQNRSPWRRNSVSTAGKRTYVQTAIPAVVELPHKFVLLASMVPRLAGPIIL